MYLNTHKIIQKYSSLSAQVVSHNYGIGILGSVVGIRYYLPFVSSSLSFS